MKKSTRKLIIFVIIYLIISSMYIVVHIDFKQPIYYENYTETSIFYNAVRIIMGIPPVVKGYEGVSPKFFAEIVIKILIAISLLLYITIDYYKNKNNITNVEEDEDFKKAKKNINVLSAIVKIIISISFVTVFLLSLYMKYCSIHWIR